MPAIAAVVADLVAHPRPLVCLDTCDLLDIIQCVAEGKARRLEHVRRLLDTLPLRPDAVKFVVSYLVPVEWTQHKASIVAEVEATMRKVDEAIADIHLAWQYTSSPLTGPAPSYAGAGLSAALATLADRVLAWATVLDKEDGCIANALDRVHQKSRPSHKGAVKDSIHLEHYLELSGQLQASNFPSRRVFVSGNKSDFCAAKDNPAIHPDLAPQLAAVGLEFFHSLEAAMGSLGI
ncbi:MAG TPA: hypothetical protein VFI31_19840 [Pirellulales bacterium]|nr:hypothetical protein [Pirellulales bacterium]